MTLNELEGQLEKISGLHYQIGKLVDDKWEPEIEPDLVDSFAFALLNNALPFYDKGGMTIITIKKLAEMPKEELKQALLKGVNVEQATRITGYFTKVKLWNKGKLGELHDRHRESGL